MRTDPDQDDLDTKRVLLIVAYQGGNYSGFARQTNAPTVAFELEAAIREIDPKAGALTGASRTDAGVHARMQPVSFATNRFLKTRGWVLSLTQKLPKDIAVLSASYVPVDFDPRRDPLWKRYRYRVFASKVEDPFLSPIAWRIGDPLDLSAMEKEAQSLQGTHDFRAFRSADDTRTETVRNLHLVTIERSTLDKRCLDIVVEGNRFMYNMVRIIAGTLVDVGRARKKPGAVRRALESGDRRDLGMTAPPQGLTLEHVQLRQVGLDTWPPIDPT